jgi:hypothetical protein
MGDQEESLSQDHARRRVLFISHKHVDEDIADVLREFLEGWTAGQIDIFQSSSSAATGPRIGRPLGEELKKALRDASVVLFLHTRADDDWSTCMWEVGVATDPESPDTRVVLLECGERIPNFFEDHVRINLRNFRDIHGFVNALLTSADFFPAFAHAVTEFVPSSPNIDRATADLIKRLDAVLPPTVDEPEHVWSPYPLLTLQVTFDQAQSIDDAQPRDRLQQTIHLLEEKVLVADGDWDAGRVYGIQAAPRSILFKRLIAAWRERTPTPSSKWIEGLACQLMDAALGQFPTLRWELMRGADRHDGAWYGPAVVRVRRIPAMHVVKFDVALCKFDVNSVGAVEIGVPKLEQPGD